MDPVMTLTDSQRDTIRNLVNHTHIELVIRELSDICIENGEWARTEMNNKAIANEWRRASRHLNNAADEIGVT